MYTKPSPDYVSMSPERSAKILSDLGYDIYAGDDIRWVNSGLFVAMARQIEYLKDELERLKSE